MNIRRDDQTIMWQLGQGARWVLNDGPPVKFLPGGPGPNGVTYSDWPGTSPAPIATGAPPDRVPYWASADHPMPDSETAYYHYEVNVETDGPDGAPVKVEVKVRLDDGTWHDPDVVNDPKP